MSGRAVWYARKLTNAPDGRKLSSAEKGVLILIADSMGSDDDAVAWPSINTMAEHLALNERTVRRCTQTLIESGILAATPRYGERGRHKTNEYRFPLWARENDQRTLATVTARPEDTGDTTRGHSRQSPEDTGASDQRAPRPPNRRRNPEEGTPSKNQPSSPPAPQAPTDVVGPQAGTPALVFIEAQRTRYREAPQQRIAIIGDVYTHLIGEKPLWARLGAALNKTGVTFDEAVSAIQEAVLRNPTDDPMSYVIAVMERKHGTKRRTTTDNRSGARGARPEASADDEAFNRKWSRRLAPGAGDGAEATRVLDGDSSDGGASGAA